MDKEKAIKYLKRRDVETEEQEHRQSDEKTIIVNKSVMPYTYTISQTGKQRVMMLYDEFPTY